MTEWRDSVLDCGSPLPLFAAVALIAAFPLSAHDRHANAAMHQDVHVLITKDHLEVTFTIESNEEATMVEAIAMDANADGKLSPEEQSAYFAQLDARLREGLNIAVEDVIVPLKTGESVELAPPARKIFRFNGVLPKDLPKDATLSVFNDNFLDWPGRTTLEVEPGGGVVFRLSSCNSVYVVGAITLPSAKPAEDVLPVTWWAWSWRGALVSPEGVILLVALVASAILFIASRERLSASDSRIIVGLIAASQMAGILFIIARNPNPASESAWRGEFKWFHETLAYELESYHQGAEATVTEIQCTPDCWERIRSATRRVSPGDEQSGTFDLTGIRHLSTTLLQMPRSILDPTLRVRHTWRVIGVMRHDGHPHERVRDFTCDYTLRVTDNGFRLLDCSDWHQLPDEPLE